MEFAILGPLEVRVDDRPVVLGGPKPRGLLAILLLHANEAVSRDRLIDALWGESPPSGAAHSLDTYVSSLRKAFSTRGSERLLRRPPGYMLLVEPGEFDLDRFDRLLEQGREELARGEANDARATLGAALELWRGPALADVLYEPFAGVEAERLEERRLLALEERIEADLALGRSSEVASELEALVREHPFRERLLGQLMLALYRSGRQAEALAAFQAGRRRLAEEVGLAPAPELVELQRKILDQHAGLAAPNVKLRSAQRVSRRGRARLIAAGAVAAAVVASAVIGTVLGTRGTSAAHVNATSSEVIGLDVDSGALARGVSLRGPPAAMAANGDSLWLADANAGAVSRVDLASKTLVERITIGGSPGAIAVGGGAVWVASVPGAEVKRIDPGTETVTQTVGLGGASASALSFGLGGLWVADTTDETLIKLDAVTGAPTRTLTLALRPTALALGQGVIWVADYDAGSIAKVDLRSGQTVATVHVGNGPVDLALGDGAVWVANSLDSTVSRVDPVSTAVAATISVGSGPTAIAVTSGSVWVTNLYSGTVSQIDPRRNAVVRTENVGGGPTALEEVAGKLWVGIKPVGRHRGGTLRLVHTRPLSIDPALQLDLGPLQSDGLTRDGLVSYDHAGGPQGTRLVPDLAVSLPTPAEGGTTYTFRLRPGIRYSDGRPLRASDFRRAFERLFRLRSDGRDLFTGIVGAAECAKRSTECDLSSGIATDDTAGTVTFRLNSAEPDFLANLTYGGLATPVPPRTPFHDTRFVPIPGTGPYKIARASRREILYVRNRFFREWSHAAQPDGNPDRIVMRFGLSAAREVQAIEQGSADWMAESIPANLLPTVERRYAGQLHSYPTPETDFFQFNTTLPPFDDVRVRQALNFAIDRRAIARLYGGRKAASPTCQILPPGLPGHRPYCPYTRNPGSDGIWKAPDLVRAKRLVSAARTRGSRVTVWGWTDDPTLSASVVGYTAGVLRRLGYQTRVRLVPHAYFDNPPPGVFKTIQVIPAGWVDTSAKNFFGPWLSCDGAIDHGWFCDPYLDREMRRAQSLDAISLRAAASVYARIDRAIVDQAAWVPLVNPRQTDFVSSRVHNFQHHPYWDVIADQFELP